MTSLSASSSMSSDGGYGKSTRESQTLLGAAGNKSISLVGNVAVVKTRKYSLASGVFIAFFMVMGGIYGNEPPGSSAAPFYITMSFMLLPILYGLPMCLMVIDLENRLPNPEGWIGWIRHEFGESLGNHNAYWTWLAYLVDAASYPCVTAGYIGKLFHTMPGYWELNYITVGFVVVLTALKAVPNLMERMQAFFFICAVVPTLLFFGFGAQYMTYDGAFGMLIHCNGTNSSLDNFGPADPTELDAGDGTGWCSSVPAMGPAAYLPYPSSPGYTGHADLALGNGTGGMTKGGCPAGTANLDLSLLLPFALWINSGFVSISAISPDLENPKRTLPLVIAILLPIVTIFSTLPYAVSLSVFPNSNLYQAGFFSDVADKIAGRWLRQMFVVAGGVATLGCYVSQIIPAEEAMASAIRQWRRRKLRLPCKACGARVIVDRFCSRCGTPQTMLPDSVGVLHLEDESGPRWLSPDFMAMIINALLVCGLVMIPFTVLVQVTMMMLTPVFVMFIMTYIKVQYRCTGRVLVPFLISFGPLAATIANFYYGLMDDTVTFGVTKLQTIALAAMISFGLLAHGLMRCCGA